MSGDYKIKLGAELVARKAFLETFRELRNQSPVKSKLSEWRDKGDCTVISDLLERWSTGTTE